MKRMTRGTCYWTERYKLSWCLSSQTPQCPRFAVSSSSRMSQYNPSYSYRLCGKHLDVGTCEVIGTMGLYRFIGQNKLLNVTNCPWHPWWWFKLWACAWVPGAKPLSVNISSSKVTVLIRFEQKITFLNLLKTSSLF